jgi:hypothetical protein
MHRALALLLAAMMLGEALGSALAGGPPAACAPRLVPQPALWPALRKTLARGGV